MEPDPADARDRSLTGVDQARGALSGATRLLVLTGAGLSTAAGIPDYRGPDGVWTRDPAAERASRSDVYASDPAVRQRAWRVLEARAADPPRPTRAHRALVAAERAGRLLGVVTQNIDGLHLAAGTSPGRLVELHGTTARVRCLACGARRPTPEVVERVRRGDPDPRCEVVVAGAACAGVLSADIVRFGDPLDASEWRRARAWADEADSLVGAGSTLSVYPAAGLVDDALARGVPVVIVNAQPTAYDDRAAALVRADVQVALPALLATA